MGEGCCTAKLPLVGQSDIGSKFAAEFVAQTYSCVDIRESRSCAAFKILLAVEVHLELRLYDQPLGKQQIIGTRYSARQMTSITEVKGRFKLKEMWCETLDTYRTPDALRP